jgi:hypothetical protein
MVAYLAHNRGPLGRNCVGEILFEMILVVFETRI